VAVLPITTRLGLSLGVDRLSLAFPPWVRYNYSLSPTLRHWRCQHRTLRRSRQPLWPTPTTASVWPVSWLWVSPWVPFVE